MMSPRPLIAVDWGTTNCRAYLLSGGEAIDRVESLAGAFGLAPEDFDRQAMAIRTRLGDHPMLLAGMVGSDIGWRPAPYCPLPVDAETLAAAAVRVDARTLIVPGVRSPSSGRPDVMRGEEVHFLGAALSGCAPPSGIFCQPGTHAKWAQLEEGRIDAFRTSMTGELFSLLGRHSILVSALGGKVVPDAHFRSGIDAALEGDLLADLFRVRAGALLAGWLPDQASSFVSGLLIGSDCAARLGEIGDRGATVHLVADDRLAPLYRAAIEALGHPVALVACDEAFAAGAEAVAGLAFGLELAA